VSVEKEKKGRGELGDLSFDFPSPDLISLPESSPLPRTLPASP